MRELTLLPSGPGTATVSCSLDDEDLAARTADWRKIAERAESRRTEPGRVVATYPKDESLLTDIRRLIAAEAECCPSLSFSVEEFSDRVVVEMRVLGTPTITT